MEPLYLVARMSNTQYLGVAGVRIRTVFCFGAKGAVARQPGASPRTVTESRPSAESAAKLTEEAQE